MTAGGCRPTETVVVVGASVAGVRCVNGLRDAGHTGPVVLLDAEAGSPYDKPQLSKRLHDAAELDLLTDAARLRERGVDFRPGVAALGLDLTGRTVETSAGPIGFDQLVVATGCRPRPLPQPVPPGAGFVRTRADWERLRDAVRSGGDLVVIGGGFLGLEAAAAAVSRGLRVSVVDVAPRVLTRGVPPLAADLVAARHDAEGVEFRLGVVDPVLVGDDQGLEVAGVRADHALVAIGAEPRLDWLAGSGLVVDDGLVCDENLVAAPGVWAAGDCARWRNARYARDERHEHWTTAVRHGQHVARSIAGGTATPMAELPYVWSDQYDWRIQSVGRVGEDAGRFTAPGGADVVVSTTDGLVTGVTTVNAPASSVKARQLLQREDPPLDAVVDRLGLVDYRRATVSTS